MSGPRWIRPLWIPARFTVDGASVRSSRRAPAPASAPSPRPAASPRAGCADRARRGGDPAPGRGKCLHRTAQVAAESKGRALPAADRSGRRAQGEAQRELPPGERGVEVTAFDRLVVEPEGCSVRRPASSESSSRRSARTHIAGAREVALHVHAGNELGQIQVADLEPFDVKRRPGLEGTAGRREIHRAAPERRLRVEPSRAGGQREVSASPGQLVRPVEGTAEGHASARARGVLAGAATLEPERRVQGAGRRVAEEGGQVEPADGAALDPIAQLVAPG